MANVFACVLVGIAVCVAPASFAWGDEYQRLDSPATEVGGEMGRRIAVTVENNLLVLDVDKDFLRPFQERSASSGYIGLGKLIDASVRFAAYTNDPRVIERKRKTVDALIAMQEDDGYLGMLKPENRLWSLWDIHEMSYAIHGLLMDHRYFGEAASLEAARKCADYIVAGWKAEPDRIPGNGEITTYMAVTGLESALLELCDVTGDRRYLDFCVDQRRILEWDGPIVLGRWGQIQGHAYAYMSRCIAQMRLYRRQADPRLLVPTRKVMDFLLEQDGLSVTGTCGQHECWHDTQDGVANLGETCATAYLMFFLDELFRLEGDPVCGDMMERAMYNALFAAQSPDGRRIRYYSPFEGPRAYFDGDTYCCPCNYRRIVSSLPDLVYYRQEGGIAVNLYAPSKVDAKLADGTQVKLAQETNYPSAGRVVLKVDPDKASAFKLSLRIPGWCEGATVLVNGEKQDVSTAAGEFCVIDREWNPGDAVQLDMPMKLRLVKGRKAQAGRVAAMYGPLVFCLNPGRNEGVTSEDPRIITLDPGTLEGPFPDDSVHPGGLACTVSAWRTTAWYPHAKHDWKLTLTEFPDPDGRAAYFHVPNPGDESLVVDELCGAAR